MQSVALSDLESPVSGGKLFLANARNYDSSLWRCMYVVSLCSTDLGSGPFVLKTSDCNGSAREVRVGRRLTSTSEFDFLGSCNGLLLLSRGLTGDDLFIWNPCSGKKKISCSDRFVPARNNFGISGLAYDSSSEDYKAVFGVWSSNSGYMDIHLYAFRTNTWKAIYIKVLPFMCGCLNFADQGTNVNGVPHWLFGKKDILRRIDNRSIADFDPAEEKFRKLSLPADRKAIFDTIALGALGGCLSVTYDSLAVGGLIMSETWVMREYGIEESWMKLFCFFPKTFFLYTYLRPLCFTTKGEVLMELDRKRLMVFNLRVGSVTQYVSSFVQNEYYYCSSSNLGFELATYMETSDFPTMDTKKKKHFWRI